MRRRGAFSFSTACAGAAALILAGALVFVPPSWGKADEGVSVQGIPFWLTETVEKSLGAVWRELSSRASREEERERVLRLVVQRLYPGYSLEFLRALPQGGLEARFSPQKGLPDNWRVYLSFPPLEAPLSEWFRKDVARLEENLVRGLEGVPSPVFGWGDVAFRDFLARETEACLPGWHGAPVMRLREGEGPEMEISFTPRPPLVLALLPSLQSETLPVILRQDLKEGMLKDLSPLVGLPVAWLRLHAAEVELWSASLLGERNVTSRADADLAVHFEAEQLSRIRVDVESASYVIQGWLAGYAGSDGHYPELGLHFGKKFSSRKDGVELYGEWIMKANDFSLESRWGLRWSPWQDIFLGGEFAYPGEDLWWRFWADPREIRSPYLWWRYNPEGEHNGALGWRINEHFSLELYYDERAGDQLSLRAVGNL
ncbi:MAG TPA: hypothetical protein PLA80_00800 [Synergistaceae bacterium]|nr:hypothetical protein [Synergistaceae bacterium]